MKFIKTEQEMNEMKKDIQNGKKKTWFINWFERTNTENIEVAPPKPIEWDFQTTMGEAIKERYKSQSQYVNIVEITDGSRFYLM